MLQIEIESLLEQLGDKKTPPTRALLRRAKRCIEELLVHEREANELADRLASFIRRGDD